ncbi:MAG: ammonia-forming cytochrome c nitrite reductase subunit c552 [Deltaproteobacteria bacterium]|jgi:nitrite reductase (cytochrome c-552)|nr:ammonia-forming cytochrome c nitrite reductase subunit c552 [Deltaproteobacteria bacterium]
MKNLYSSKYGPWIIGLAISLGVAVAVVVLALVAATVTFRRAEVASVYNNKKVDIKGIQPDSSVWGQNYPREYETWKRTADMNFKSKHLGNIPQNSLSDRPDMVILWAGYAFARDYSAPRGHFYTIEDMRGTLRTGSPGVDEQKDLQPSTCWSCKSPDVPRMIEQMGAEDFYKSPWSSMGPQIVNSIGCADCHNPANMDLTITRPALREAYQRLGRDIDQAPIQEKRSLVCAQCHVEYYFQGDGKYLTFPWDNGYTMENMETYYDEADYADWTHAVSKTRMLKAQHPDWELFLLGPHGQKGLSCADCHMPYISEGGVKFSDHQLVSPLNNISSSCQVCHRDSEETLKELVYFNQDRLLETRNRLEPELAKTHILTKMAIDGGISDEELAPVRALIRQAQWRWDFGVASHGASFHAPVETQRILSHGLDKTLQAQLLLKDLFRAHNLEIGELPDISTKEKAQQFIGLNPQKLNEQKAMFLTSVVPQWLEEAKAQGRI